MIICRNDAVPASEWHWVYSCSRVNPTHSLTQSLTHFCEHLRVHWACWQHFLCILCNI